MKKNFDKSLLEVLKSEGGFQKDERDPGNAKGGMTNLGCTKAVWEEFVGHPVSEADMRALTPASVAPLYKRKYWDKVAGDLLPAGLDYAVFDAAINSGPGRAAKWLQEVAGVPADGSIGKQTLAAVDAFSPLELIAQYNDKRLQFLESLPTFATFGKGWSNRVSSVQSIASREAA
jgi:lysozyme family protein